MLVNPGRLRKYHLWTESPWEDEDEVEPPTGMDKEDPKVGHLVAVGLELNPHSTRPFAIGQIREISEAGSYIIHWYGNTDRNVEGTYRPEWRSPTGKDTTHIQYKSEIENDTGAYRFTSVEAKMDVKRRNILHFGFDLLYNDRLPPTLLKKLRANTNLNWKIPKS